MMLDYVAEPAGFLNPWARTWSAPPLVAVAAVAAPSEALGPPLRLTGPFFPISQIRTIEGFAVCHVVSGGGAIGELVIEPERAVAGVRSMGGAIAVAVFEASVSVEKTLSGGGADGRPVFDPLAERALIYAMDDDDPGRAQVLIETYERLTSGR